MAEVKLDNTLLRLSIVKSLAEKIAALQTLYLLKDSACFIRVEGGMARPLAINQSGEQFLDPIQEINYLFCSEELKAELLGVFSRLLPGTCLILLDSDSGEMGELPNNSITDWFIVSA